MSKRIITTRDSDGHVLCEWQGGDEQTLQPVAGRTYRELQPDDTKDYSRHRWNGRTFEALPVAPATETVEDQLRRVETKLDELLNR